jgi:hypothetical protein
MKKRNLYKLIKEQLKIALKEEAFKRKTQKRNTSILKERWKKSLKKWKILKEQQITENKENIQEVYNFLVTSYERNISLEDVLSSPLLANYDINIISEIYPIILQYTLEEFIELFQLTVWGGDGQGIEWEGCGFTFTGGPIEIYDLGGCSQSTSTISNSFVCCSDNNNFAQNWSGNGDVNAFSMSTGNPFGGVGATNMWGNTNAGGPALSTCYCPNPTVSNGQLTSCGITSLTALDFDNWLQSITLGTPITLSDFGAGSGGSCAGCGQQAATGDGAYGTNPWIGGAGGTLGCPTDNSLNEASWNGQLDVNDLSCCTFQGCNEDGATPYPNNISEFTLQNSSVITANTTDAWFQNNNTCDYDGCPGYSVTIFGTIYSAPITVPTGVVDAGAGYTVTNDNSCVMDGCTDTTIQFTDPYTGVDYLNNYIAPTADYTVTQTNAVCEIQACTDPTDLNGDTNLNYVDTSQWSGTWNVINTGCISTAGLIGGCMDIDADNYDASVDYDDGSCYYLGCTDGTTPASNYDPTATVDDGSCTYPGCMLGETLSTLTSNYDNNANVEDNSCEVTACDDPTANNYFCDLVDGQINVGSYYCTAAGLPDLSTMASFAVPTGICTYDAGCTHPLAENYNSLASSDDGLCYWEYCSDSNAFNYSINQPIITSGPNANAIIAFTSNVNNLDEPAKCEYLGCNVVTNGTIGSGGINATTGTQGEDNGYQIDNDGCVAGVDAGLTTIPYPLANSIELSGQLSSTDISCCEFPGCYNAGLPNNGTYNQDVGGFTFTPTINQWSINATSDDGTCEYYGCPDENASNYFCIANPDLCNGQTGGVIDPNIGFITDNGQCEYNLCKNVEAVSCSNPSGTINPSQSTINIECLTIGGQVPDLVTNNQFLATYTPNITGGGNTLSEQQSTQTCWKVTSVTPSLVGTQNDRPTCICDPEITWDCCTYATCPGSLQWHFADLIAQGIPTPSVNSNKKFCMPRFDGSGQYQSLGTKNGCTWNCKDQIGPKGKGIDPSKTSIAPLPDEETLEMPEINESKKLRKLIKKWRKNNL